MHSRQYFFTYYHYKSLQIATIFTIAGLLFGSEESLSQESVLRGAESKALRCEQLVDSKEVMSAIAELRAPAIGVIDLTRDQISKPVKARQQKEYDALKERMRTYREKGRSLRVVAIDLPQNAPLVEMTCAIGRGLELNVNDTLIVLTTFGMHAWSGALTYRQLRETARSHQNLIKKMPLTAVTFYADTIMEKMENQGKKRHFLLTLSVISFIAGLIGLCTLLLSPHE